MSDADRQAKLAAYRERRQRAGTVAPGSPAPFLQSPTSPTSSESGSDAARSRSASVAPNSNTTTNNNNNNNFASGPIQAQTVSNESASSTSNSNTNNTNNTNSTNSTNANANASAHSNADANNVTGDDAQNGQMSNNEFMRRADAMIQEYKRVAREIAAKAAADVRAAHQREIAALAEAERAKLTAEQRVRNDTEQLLSQEREQLQKQHEDLRERELRLDSKVRELVEEKRNEWESHIGTILERRHDTVLAEMRLRHTSEIERMRKDAADSLTRTRDELRREQQEALARAASEHAAQREREGKLEEERRLRLTDDFSARISALEAEIDAARTRHETEVRALRDSHSNQVQRIENDSLAREDALRAEVTSLSAKLLEASRAESEARAKCERAEREANQDALLRKELDEARKTIFVLQSANHDLTRKVKDEISAAHATELTTLRSDYEARLAAVCKERDEIQRSLDMTSTTRLATIETEHAARLKAAIEESANERETLRVRLETEREELVAHMRKVHEKQMAALEADLERARKHTVEALAGRDAEWEARLDQAHSNASKKMRETLDASAAQSVKLREEYDALAAAHQQKIEALTAEWKARVDNSAGRIVQLEDQVRVLEASKSDADQSLRSALSTRDAEWDEKVRVLRRSHEEALQKQHDEWSSKLDVVRKEHAEKQSAMSQEVSRWKAAVGTKEVEMQEKLAAADDVHSAAMDDLRNAHLGQIRTLEDQLAAVRRDCDAKISEIRAEEQTRRLSLLQQSDDRLAAAQSKHAEELVDLQQKIADAASAKETLRLTHRSEVAALEEAHVAQTEKTRQENAAELQRLRSEHDARMDKLRADMNELQQKHAEAVKKLEADHEARRQALVTECDARVAAVEVSLEDARKNHAEARKRQDASHAAQLDARDAKHREAVAQATERAVGDAERTHHDALQRLSAERDAQIQQIKADMRSEAARADARYDALRLAHADDLQRLSDVKEAEVRALEERHRERAIAQRAEMDALHAQYRSQIASLQRDQDAQVQQVRKQWDTEVANQRAVLERAEERLRQAESDRATRVAEAERMLETVRSESAQRLAEAEKAFTAALEKRESRISELERSLGEAHEAKLQELALLRSENDKRVAELLQQAEERRAEAAKAVEEERRVWAAERLQLEDASRRNADEARRAALVEGEKILAAARNDWEEMKESLAGEVSAAEAKAREDAAEAQQRMYTKIVELQNEYSAAYRAQDVAHKQRLDALIVETSTKWTAWQEHLGDIQKQYEEQLQALSDRHRAESDRSATQHRAAVEALQLQLEQLRASNASELQTLHLQHEEALANLRTFFADQSARAEDAHAKDRERLRAQLDSAWASKLSAQRQDDLALSLQQREAAVAKVRDEHEAQFSVRVASVEDLYRRQLLAMAEQHDEQMIVRSAQFEQSLASQQEFWERRLATIQEQHVRDLAEVEKRIAEASSERHAAFVLAQKQRDEYAMLAHELGRLEWEETTRQAVADATHRASLWRQDQEAAWRQNVRDSVRVELDAELKAFEARHEKELRESDAAHGEALRRAADDAQRILLEAHKQHAASVNTLRAELRAEHARRVTQIEAEWSAIATRNNTEFEATIEAHLQDALRARDAADAERQAEYAQRHADALKDMEARAEKRVRDEERRCQEALAANQRNLRVELDEQVQQRRQEIETQARQLVEEYEKKETDRRMELETQLRVEYAEAIRAAKEAHAEECNRAAEASKVHVQEQVEALRPIVEAEIRGAIEQEIAARERTAVIAEHNARVAAALAATEAARIEAENVIRGEYDQLLGDTLLARSAEEARLRTLREEQHRLEMTKQAEQWQVKLDEATQMVIATEQKVHDQVEAALKEERAATEAEKAREEALRKERAALEQAQRQREAEAAEQQKGREEQLGKLRGRLSELWGALESDTAERADFLWQCELRAGFSQDVLDMYRAEIDRLTDQLPVMETITRREFIKYRLRELRNKEQQAMNNNGPSTSMNSSAATAGGKARAARDEQQKRELENELRRLTTDLARDIPPVEKKYGRPLLFRNKHYLQVIMDEQRTGQLIHLTVPSGNNNENVRSSNNMTASSTMMGNNNTQASVSQIALSSSQGPNKSSASALNQSTGSTTSAPVSPAAGRT